MKGVMTEVKMSRMSKISDLDQKKKTYPRGDRVSVLGLVCDKMVKRVSMTRQEDDHRWMRQEVDNPSRIVESGEEDTEDDEGAGVERDIWSFTEG